MTPEELVLNVLLGNGVTAWNVSYNGAPANATIVQPNAGYFDANNTGWPISSGVVLSSGNVSTVPGIGSDFSSGTMGTGSDPDLALIEPAGINDRCVIEFDFIPSGDSIKFQYMFASEEYPEFVFSGFNDAFGFFISGPGFAGPYSNASVNIALIPGTSTPVTIDNVNATTNSQYYVDNASDVYGPTVQFDAFTVVLTAAAEVQCGQTYHIKLAIGDAGDSAYDSAVFLAADSFSADAVDVTVATVTGDTTIVEGCTDANFILSRPDTLDTLIIDYTITGSAIEGTDYNNMPNPITFLPGEDTIIINLTPVSDGLVEGPEWVTFTTYTVNICGDTIESSGTLWIMDEPIIEIFENDTTLLCADDSILTSVYATGGLPPYTYSWSNGATGPDAYVSASINGPTEYYVTATDDCGFQQTDTVTIILNQTLSIDTLISYPSSACLPDGAVSATVSGISGTPLYNWNGPGPNNPNFIQATVWQNIPSGWYYFTVTDNVCEISDSIFVDPLDPPMADFTPTAPSGCSPLSVNFVNNSQNTVNYEWHFNNGDPVATTTNASAVFTSSTTVMLIASDANNCADTAYAIVSVVACGCTDPLAENYDPNAVQDDGSCVYPIPTVVAPNVFTPNDDGDNDVFFLTTTNTVEVDLVITNRWGNVMFETTSPNPAWNGKVNGNGADASEGVYFFRYKAVGVNGDEVEGHGFLHLIRD